MATCEMIGGTWVSDTYHACTSAHPAICQGCTTDESKHGQPVAVLAAMPNVKPTKHDYAAFEQVQQTIATIRDDLARHFPEYKPSEWQFLYTVADKGDVGVGRMNRLIAIGLLESKPSDGSGPSIRINPNYRRYL